MYPDVASRSHRFFERAQGVFPGGNTRHTVFFAPYPIYAASGRGCRVTDVDGVERIDFINNYSALIHGHSHPAVVEAVQLQASKLMAVGLPTQAEIELAELLVSRLPCVEKLRFCNSGSEAVMFAIRAARAYTGRSKIAKVEGAFHGAYDYAEVSMDPMPQDWGNPDPVPVAHAAGTPKNLLRDVVVIPFNDVPETRRILDAHKGEIAAILLDPIVSRMAFLEATPEYIDLLHEYKRATDTLVIADEVFSFRINYRGAQARYKIDADLTALGKIIGGGVAIGAVGGKAEVMQVFEQHDGHARVPHGGTYNANPLAMVAGKVSMDLLTAEAIERINALGDRLRSGINGLLQRNEVPGKALGVGSMVSLILGEAEFTNYRGFLPAAAQSVPRVTALHRLMLNRGVLFIPHGGFVTSTAMAEPEIDFTLNALDESLHELQAVA